MVALVAADAADLIDPNNPDHLKIEAAIRNEICKHTGKLMESDLLKVTRLILGHNQITDVSPLKELTQLKMLDLGHNQITDVSALKELKQLEHLNLWSSGISFSDIDALQEALPDCRIFNIPGAPG